MARPLAKDHDDKRDFILSRATAVFASTGFDRASMSQVATECGLSKAALYHYFSGKNAILFAILERHLKALRDHILACSPTGKTAQAYLVEIVEEILVFYRGHDDVHELQLNALSQLEEADQRVLIGFMRDLVAHVAQTIEAVHPQSFPADDPQKLRMATMSLFGMLNWYYTWNRGRGIEGRREYARFAAQILLKGAYEPFD